MSFYLIENDKIDLFWPEASAILERSFNGIMHTHKIEDYYDLLKENQMQLWAAQINEEMVGCVVTTIHEGTVANALQIFSLAGEKLKYWVEDMDVELSLFAQKNGCQLIEAITRQGFSRFVPDFVEDGRRYIKIIKGEK